MEEYKTQKINLFGDVWTIRYVKHVIRLKDSNDTYWGMAYHQKRLIEVSVTDDDGKPYSKDTIRLNTLHELMHACFGAGQYWKENDDEPLVEWMAKCINEIFKKNILK